MFLTTVLWNTLIVSLFTSLEAKQPFRLGSVFLTPRRMEFPIGPIPHFPQTQPNPGPRFRAKSNHSWFVDQHDVPRMVQFPVGRSSRFSPLTCVQDKPTMAGRFIILTKSGQRGLEVRRSANCRGKSQGARGSRCSMAFSYQPTAESTSARTE